MESVAVKAPAKINLGLHVLEKRSDGFHEIETAMLAVQWFDYLNFEQSDTIELSCSDPSLPTDDNNLVVKAARSLSDLAGFDGGVRIRLDKQIPHAAGLGGGSSDAAATLNALNALWDLQLPEEKLAEIAATLGSDVPFFLSHLPAMSTGRGEILNPIEVDGKPFRLNHQILIVVPGVGISTAEAYGSISPNAQDRPDIRQILTTQPVTDWSGVLVNDFQEMAFRKRPELIKIFDYLTMVGADYVSLSGSGSAIFGIFTSADAAKRADSKLKGYGLNTWCGRELDLSSSDRS